MRGTAPAISTPYRGTSLIRKQLRERLQGYLAHKKTPTPTQSEERVPSGSTQGSWKDEGDGTGQRRKSVLGELHKPG